MQRSRLISVISTVLLFIALEVLSIVMVSKNSIVQRYRIMGGVRNSQSAMWNTSRKVQYFINYRVENERLAQENLKLREDLERYRTIMDSRDSLTVEPLYSYIQARVIKNSTNKQYNYIILNKGADKGIKPGMGVITDKGIVGVVNAVEKHHCQVISFLSADQRVSAKLTKNGSFGPLCWNGHSVMNAVMSEIPAHTEVAVGDTISTSGFSTIYPPDIPVGRVAKISENGVALDLTVALFQNFSALQYVYVIVNNNIDEIKGLEESNEE